MDMQKALRARLLGAQSVSAIVGTKVDWLERPEGDALPAITLQVISGTLDQHMQGLQGLQFARVQLDCWGDSYAQTKSLVDAALEVVLPRGTIAGVYFRTASATMPRDLGERTDTQFIHRKQTDLTVRYSAA
ncbi:tail completion protein gp17 [Sphingobium sp.]|uniref:tail completion protein gp17 n=1 Tax=Sphingobium sp. TaxID=1912891 RepID=UPI003BB6636A